MALSLDRLLRPRSVAIVGASDKPGALGAAVLANLDRWGFAGDIHLINPKRDEIAGRPCVASVENLPPGVDAAVLAIPRAAVLDTVRGLAARGCGAAVIFSAGFAEGGESGRAEQDELARIAGGANMVLEGPNCLGMVNFVDGVPLTFIETPRMPLAGRPGIGIVSQSGAMAAVLGTMLLNRDLGLSHSISTGNEAGSGVEDYVDALVDDPHTRLITMIVEQFRKPARFLAAAGRARAASKPIVLLHPGRSSAARESAATHTGAMAGDYKVMSLKVARAGVVHVETLEELGDVTEILLRCPPMGAGGTAVLTESGAYKALTLDLAESVGLPLPVIADAGSPALRAAMPDFVPVTNPLDVTAQGLVEPDIYRRTIEALDADERFGSILLGIIQTDTTTCGIKFPVIIDALARRPPHKPVLLAGLDEGAPVLPQYIARLRQIGIPYFPSAERAVRALARIARWRGQVPAADHVEPLHVRLPVPGGVIPEYRAKALLGPVGVPFPPSRLAASLEEAQAAAEALGWPVVLKAQSPALSHKSDAGGVAVGLADAAGLRAAWMRMTAAVEAYAPGLVLDGMLVEKMGARGLELIVGARNDPEWGPVILVGFGGVQAEILQDVRLLTPDMDKPAVLAELTRLKSAALLTGFRGAAALDTGAVADLILAVGRVLAGEPRIREIDLNPVLAYPQGQGVMALDALMLVAD